jgi:FAD/FMN-containing dehydrogenase
VTGGHHPCVLGRALIVQRFDPGHGRHHDGMYLSRRELIAAAALVGVGISPLELDRLPPGQLRALRDAVRGRVLTPGSSAYNRARLVFNRRYDGVKPPAVVQVRDVADVRAVVRWAERFDVPLISRSGGHAYNGASTSGSAVVVDLGRLDGVRLRDGIATVGPGARNIDVYAKLARHGATIPSGSCPTVGIGGCRPAAGWGSPAASWG